MLILKQYPSANVSPPEEGKALFFVDQNNQPRVLASNNVEAPLRGESGYSGISGFSGKEGRDGQFGGASFYYKFLTKTDTNDPNSGFLNINNADLSLGTFIVIDNTDRFGTNIASFIQTIDDSTSDIKGFAKITEEANTTNFVIYAITGTHIDDANHFDIPVSYVSGVATPFSNTANVVITFTVTGDKGDQGISGWSGWSGISGFSGISGWSGISGFSGSSGISGFSGLSGFSGTNGTTGTSGFSGFSGINGPGTAINATETTASGTYYPVFVAAAGTNQTPRIRATSVAFSFNPGTGEVAATDFNSLSDETLKNNIKPIVNAFDVISKLNPVSFNWNNMDKKSFGFIAQEIEKVLPEIVIETQGKKALSYTQIIPFLVEAIQQQQKQIDELKNIVDKFN
jgi:hypothetical protein